MTPEASGGPSRAWYWVGGAVGLVGIVATVLWVAGGVRGFTGQVDDFQRVDVGDEAPVTIDEPGGYTIYYEGPGAEAGEPDVDVTIRGPGITQASLDEYDGTLTYTVGGREGRAVLTVDIDQPGAFVLSATSMEEEGQVAIGPSLAPRLVRTIVGAILLGLYTLGATAGVVLLTALRRRDARRRRPDPTPRIG